jgi:S-formylglutathione hydrolase FrmB
MKNIFLFFFLPVCSIVNAQVNLKVELAPQFAGPYNGRLYVYTLKDTSGQFNERTMAEEPAFYLPVKNWQAGQTINFKSGTTPSHTAIDSLGKGVYKLIAILDTNTNERANSAPGNLYSRVEGLLQVSAPGRGEGLVTLSNVFQERQFRETPLAKEISFQSGLLSEFRKKPIFIKAAIVFPASYAADSARRYPVVFIIPGWGGTHHHGAISGNQQLYGMDLGKDKIYIYLNPETQTPWGLHAFVDSRVNGPWGKALVSEFIPYLEQHFNVTRNPRQRFLMGQSSGGYGAVWLALNYPASFGGCWATSPDPLDFSSFTGVDLYKDKNYYTSAKGEERGINRVNGVFQQTLRQARQAELFAGDGGQQQSFEAAFGLPGKDGRPKDLFDPRTGTIDQQVVKEWQPYDLALLVKTQWPRIKKDGVGKITIYAGGRDNYRLNESVLAFEQKAIAAGADIRVVILADANHFQVRTRELSTTIQQEIDNLISQ